MSKTEAMPIAGSPTTMTAHKDQMSQGTSLAEAIGHTPLVRLRRIECDVAPVQLWAKAEWFNPGGSVKDRAAYNIIREAERAGRLTKETPLLDATSGNTGIAYAMLGASLGYRIKLCVPKNASRHTIDTLRAFGAEVVLTDPLRGSDGAIEAARRLAAADPQRYFYADQYNNEANWRAHYETTGVEIWEQTRGAVTHFIAGMGTSGTFMGTTRRLKAYEPRVRAIAVQPDAPLNGLEGLKHMATSIVPGIYDASLADEQAGIGTEEAYEAVKRLAREEGLLVGPSSGAALVAGLRVAKRAAQGVVVMIFPDGGAKYFHERLWDAA